VTCPHAKPMQGLTHTRGCSLKETRSVTPNSISVYHMPCTEKCYNGDYESCPFYIAPVEAV